MGADGRDSAISQGSLRIAANSGKLEGTREDSPRSFQKEQSLADPFISDF